ncbi:MAG TPA: hypothetical protein VF146_12175 [Bryobacteraceae bacterium]
MTKLYFQIRRAAAALPYCTAVLAFATIAQSNVFAQDGHSHTSGEQQELTAEQQTGAETLLKAVRQSTAQYKDVSVAEAAGYHLQFGCVSGDDSGAMGLHYINSDLVGSGVLDPAHPQIVIYEPKPDGTLQLIGADFLVIADAWNAAHTSPPQLMGQMFHLFTSPNRFGLPAFYTLHVWAWKQNPKGAFVNWHPNVSCQSFTAQ